MGPVPPAGWPTSRWRTAGSSRSVSVVRPAASSTSRDARSHLGSSTSTPTWTSRGSGTPRSTPSCFHGVTTVFGGNCGFTVAPLDDDAGAYLMTMLARVEGMPLESLQAGVPWDWRSTAEYLDRLDGTLMLNAGFLVGHSALRRVVMGVEATERSATGAELEQMEGLLRDGLAAGGIGFSSSWGINHSDADGKPVPSSRRGRRRAGPAGIHLQGVHGNIARVPARGAGAPGGSDRRDDQDVGGCAASAQLERDLPEVAPRRRHPPQGRDRRSCPGLVGQGGGARARPTSTPRGSTSTADS